MFRILVVDDDKNTRLLLRAVLDPEGRLSLMTIHGARKLKTLVVFPSIFKGKHVKHTKMVEILKGRDIIAASGCYISF